MLSRQYYVCLAPPWHSRERVWLCGYKKKMLLCVQLIRNIVGEWQEQCLCAHALGFLWHVSGWMDRWLACRRHGTSCRDLCAEFWNVCVDFAKPMGLFAFVLCMCCMALWSVRKTSFRSKSLQRMSLCMCIGLLVPCVYGMVLSLLHLRLVYMLAVLVPYNMGIGTLKDQRCKSMAPEKACRPSPTGSAVASKLKPWNISCIKGRQNKKLARLMFCRMCRKVNCKISMQEGLRHGYNVVCEVVMCVSSAFCVWQNIWKHHRLVRVVVFSLFWLLSGGDTEYGCLSTMCILCTLCNLHCTWCRIRSFVTCCLACPSHNVTVAACFAMLVPFAPRVVFPALEIRASGSRQKAAKCIRWRCRNRDMLSSRTLETKAMSSEECQRHKEEIESAIGRQDNFVDKYKSLWDRMKILMTWDRMAIRIEGASDACLGRAIVQTRNVFVQNKLKQHVCKDGAKKMYRSAATVMRSLHVLADMCQQV